MIRTYSLKKDGNTKVSNNFKVKEFKCNDGADKILIDTELVKRLQLLRDKLGAIIITSGYRTSSYNAKVGGVGDSQHLLGKAVDIVCSKPVQVVREEARKLGLFVVEYDNFTHIDTRNIIGLELKTIRKGSKGELVSYLQQCLTNKGYRTFVDGIFGKNTLSNVKAFQRNNGLLADGIVGSKTWAKLEA